LDAKGVDHDNATNIQAALREVAAVVTSRSNRTIEFYHWEQSVGSTNAVVEDVRT